jgi:hypothetical protein
MGRLPNESAAEDLNGCLRASFFSPGLKVNSNVMSDISFGKEFSDEIDTEVRASRRCLRAIPGKIYKYKPHEKSMELGYLAFGRGYAQVDHRHYRKI